MKLDKKQIQFIDETLKLNGVVYQDVKLELIDHIATDIEEYAQENNSDFVEAFKIVFEKWKPELEPTTGTILLVNDFKGPKIVVDRLISYSKQELRFFLTLTLIFGSLMSGLLYLNLQADALKIVGYFIRASFVFYISVSIIGLLFIKISGIKTTYSKLFLTRITQILGIPLMLSLEILQYPFPIKLFPLGNLIMNFVVIAVLFSCLFTVKSLFEHFKTVRKYKLI